MTSELEQRVAALIAEGRHGQAAALCLERGAAKRAAELFASVWKYEEAVGAAEQARRFDLAFEYALGGQLRDAAARIMAALADHPGQARAAARHAEGKGLYAEAARLLEITGDLQGAGDLFERARELFDAGRCHEAEGRYRQAGLLYERRLRDAPEDGEAALRLGRILLQFGRCEDAARALQQASKGQEQHTAALKLLVACFMTMGFSEAAQSHLDDLRRDDPTLPSTVPDFLEAQFGDPRGPGAASAEGDLLGGRYRVVRSLGAGATGRVLLARDGFYDRDVAIKVLTVSGGARGRDAYVRFAREARVAAGIDHPNVVRVFEFNPDGPYLVMELMAGGTLEERLGPPGERRMATDSVRQTLLSVLAGLEAVHGRGVVHRDLKPANIFFSVAGDVKLGDFGVAHLADQGATLTGALLGTLAYMAPEQITGAGNPGAFTDVYALGVILHRMLTGCLPFAGPDFVTQHLEDPPPIASQVAPGLGTTFDSLLARMLRKDVNDRIQSAAEVRVAVEAIAWPVEDAIAAAQRHGGAAGPSAAQETAVQPAEEPAGDEKATPERYAPVSGYRHHDELLDRAVTIEPSNPGRLARLKDLARADGPFLQAVYEINAERGHAILEWPAGTRLSETRPSEEMRERVQSHVRQALERLHAAGTSHGAVTRSCILVSAGRAVLLLPASSQDPGTAQSDLAAIEHLWR